MRALSVFSGIGAFDYGVQNAGWEIAGQIEIDEFCQNALKKHWPNVWKGRDVKQITGELIRERCGRIDVVFGGPPCQPASVAGSRRGADDERWLWPEFLRLVSEIRPLWVLAENPRGVTSINIDGSKFPIWLADRLHALGYSLLPIELAAEDVGAPHRRERVWFVAYRNGERQQQPEGRERDERGRIEHRSISMAITKSNGWRERRSKSEREQGRSDAPEFGYAMEHANGYAPEQATQSREASTGWIGDSGETVANSQSFAEREPDHEARTVSREWPWANTGRRGNGREWRWPARPGEYQFEWEEPRVATKSALCPSVNGAARDVARWRRCALQGIGNACVPQCAQVIAEMINRFMEVP